MIGLIYLLNSMDNKPAQSCRNSASETTVIHLLFRTTTVPCLCHSANKYHSFSASSKLKANQIKSKPLKRIRHQTLHYHVAGAFPTLPSHRDRGHKLVSIVASGSCSFLSCPYVVGKVKEWEFVRRTSMQHSPRSPWRR